MMFDVRRWGTIDESKLPKPELEVAGHYEDDDGVHEVIFYRQAGLYETRCGSTRANTPPPPLNRLPTCRKCVSARLSHEVEKMKQEPPKPVVREEDIDWAKYTGLPARALKREESSDD